VQRGATPGRDAQPVITGLAFNMEDRSSAATTTTGSRAARSRWP
jgi:hypothetical protein